MKTVGDLLKEKGGYRRFDDQIKRRNMKLKDFLSLDLKAALGTVLTVTGGAALVLNAFGKDAAASAVQACGENINALSLDSVEACKEAGKLTAEAGKEVIKSAVAAPMIVLGSFLNLFGKIKKK